MPDRSVGIGRVWVKHRGVEGYNNVNPIEVECCREWTWGVGFHDFSIAGALASAVNGDGYPHLERVPHLANLTDCQVRSG